MKKLLIIFAVLILAVAAFAANEIRFWDAPNQQRCVVIARASDGYRWDTMASDFVSDVFDVNAAIDLTEYKGRYTTIFPATIAAGDYEMVMYDTNAALFDSNNIFADGYDFHWDGSAEITSCYLNMQWIIAEAKILADINEVAVKANQSIEDINRVEGKVNDTLADSNELQSALAGLLVDINDLKAIRSVPGGQ